MPLLSVMPWSCRPWRKTVPNLILTFIMLLLFACPGPALAMHITEGLLPGKVALLWFVVS